MIDDTPVEASFDDTSTLGDHQPRHHHHQMADTSHQPTATTDEEEKNPFENIPAAAAATIAAAPAKLGGEVKRSLTQSSSDVLRSSSGSIRLAKRPHRPSGGAPSTSSSLTSSSSSSATASALISSVEDSKRSSSSSSNSSAGNNNKTKNRKSSTASTDSSSSNGSSTAATTTTNSGSGESHTSSFKTSSRALAHKLTAAENESDAALDFGPSDAPHKEPKKIVRARANIWGAKIEKTAGLNRCGCQAYKVIVQDEVRLSMWALLVLAGLVAVGFFIAKSVTGRSILFFYNGYAHTVAATVAGVFSALACLLTFLQVQAHRRHWVHPASQKHVVRILFMVPVYAISAWLSLAFVKLSAYIDFVRNCYEAYVIWSFMLLLTEYLGGHTGVAGMMRIKLKQKWPFPMCCMPRAKPDSRFLWYLKYGALQYVIFSPIFAALTIILAGIDSPDASLVPTTTTTNSTSTEEDVKYCTDFYCDGEFRYDRGYGYITFMQNATQLLSLYTLAWLYLLMRQELKPYKPVPKFLVVKAVVFFTFWQGVALAAAVKMGLLHATTNFDVGELQVGVQDFLVCIEMFIAAAVHKYTFGYETYVDGTFAILMEQRRKGDSLNIPSGARLRIVNETSEGKSIWEPRTTKLTIEEEEPQVLTLIVEEPEGVPPALFDDDQWNDIDATAGVDAPPDDEDNNGAHLPRHSVSPMSRHVELEMMTTRPSPKDLDHSEQGVDTLMDLVEE